MILSNIKSNLKKDLFQIRFAIIPIIIYCVIMQIYFGTICPFKAFTGMDCPGCGLTHAAIYLLKGNFQKSLEANSTCILWLVSILIFLIDRYIYKLKIKPFPIIFIIVGLITNFRYIYYIIK